MAPRSLSFTEIQTAMTCLARWDYGYGGRLAGTALKPRAIAPILSDGRAWGAAVAAWHADAGAGAGLFTPWDSMRARWGGLEAMRASFAADLNEQTATGVAVDLAAQVERMDRLAAIFDHYCSTAEKLRNLTLLEGEFDVAIPSRNGGRSSTRYHFGGFLDGFTIDEREHEWLVEFKLRAGLQRAEQIQLSRQIRWYAWARQRITGNPVVGVIVDERWNEAPKPARIVKGRQKGAHAVSHAKDQLTTPASYTAACAEFGEDPHEDVLAVLAAREWQKRTAIMFTPGELDEAGRELVSAGRLIRDLDNGALWPIRNAQQQLCSGCRFKAI